MNELELTSESPEALLALLTLLPGKIAGLFGLHYWRVVPTADANTTFAMSLTVLAVVLFYSFKAKGAGGGDAGGADTAGAAHALAPPGAPGSRSARSSPTTAAATAKPS